MDDIDHAPFHVKEGSLPCTTLVMKPLLVGDCGITLAVYLSQLPLRLTLSHSFARLKTLTSHYPRIR